MSRRLFITRSLASADPLRIQLEGKGFDVSGHSMLQFEALKIGELPTAEWLFAYSPRGIKFLLEKTQLSELKQFKIAAVGQGTADAWQEHGVPVNFIGDGEPASTAEAFAKTHCIHSAPCVIFLQAANSRRSVEKRLGAQVIAKRLSTYQSIINPLCGIPAAEVYYLTSPLSAEAVLTKIDPTRQFDIWCVGSVTASHVRQLGFRVQRIRPLI